MSDLFIIGKSKTALCQCGILARVSECVELALKGQTCILEATQVWPFKTGTEEAGPGLEGSACFKDTSPRWRLEETPHYLHTASFKTNVCFGVGVDVNT